MIFLLLKLLWLLTGVRLIAIVDITTFKLKKDVQLLAQWYGVKTLISLCEFYVPL